MKNITPFLWFDDRAEEAARLYTSIFPNSKVESILRYGDAGPGPKGSVMTVAFTLNGQSYTALNGGPLYQFTPAVSLVVHCETQEEVDHYWHELSDGGRQDQCGWLNDRFGLSWQVVPGLLLDMLNDKDAARTTRVMQAMLQMKKIEIHKLQLAYEQA
jgi:predicted 3-demethylubiquinone-9 3-methyltransferase (glyoxalase superfamily)